MKINGNDIIQKLKKERTDDRKKISLYVSKSLYETFKEHCGDLPASVVLEELLRGFVATSGKPRLRKA